MLQYGDVRIYSINTSGLTVFHMAADEYLVLQHIPNNNIFQQERVSEHTDSCNTNDDFWVGRRCYRPGLVRNERTGFYYEPDDDECRHEDEAWLDYVEYMMDH
ncbi:hypothetical protein PF006_g27521 [Phytophthora fragariae]|uniref:Uncharacterized protein n=1 Tax=Phytophthora fragariae TaxID=53985 RepID=A0A6A3QM99_9STRA|nr:hypothetical protein PF011_g27545 [Phytophthora fragariae]KAE9079431.1 hypothetical protein PF006_g27521 [Phytophthora fragariae]